MIDTHAHLDGPEFADTLEDTLQRAQEAGVKKILVPGICLKDTPHLLDVCHKHPDYLYPMIGLHPENIMDEDYHQALDKLENLLRDHIGSIVAVGEVGLDLYWDTTHKREQLEAFERQIQWAEHYGLPLSIHARNAHAELMQAMTPHRDRLHGGVFHCFTGNEDEARDLLTFPDFMLGIGGVLTFKKSTLPEVVKNAIPLSRIVLETDSPYMAPVPHRGKQNESAYVKNVAEKLADILGLTFDAIVHQTTENALKVFPKTTFFEKK